MNNDPFIKQKSETASKPNYKLRRNVAIGAVAVVSVLGGLKATEGNHESSLADLPTQTATIPEGGGAIDAIKQVDPRVTDSAWNNPEAAKKLQELKDEIAPNGIVQPGLVEVPVMPGQQYENPQNP